jgi:hypothetical protein
MPSALFVEAGAGAGRLVNRAGTVKERRTLPLCSWASARSGVVEGASGEDMVVAHAGMSSLGGRTVLSLVEYKQRCSRRTCRTVVCLCVSLRAGR